jgi:hypothetical protein
MPLTSVLGTLVGLVLIFWNKLVLLVSRITGRPLKKGEADETGSAGASAGRTEGPPQS